MSDKIYVGTGKVLEFKQGRKALKFSFTAEHLEILQAHLLDGWVSIVISKRREPSQSGQTHYATVDTWQPRQDNDDRDNAPF